MLKLELPLVVSGCVAVALMQGYWPQRPLNETITLGFNEKVVSYSTDFLRATSFGHSRVMSSLLWLRFLQHTPPEKMGSDQVSWMYHDLNAVTDLDPDFRPAYEKGGIFLSVITEDKIGAERIFLKGIRRFPDRWQLHAYLAYHYQFELKEPEKAGAEYLAAGSIPGSPALMKVLASSAVAKDRGVGPAIDLLKGFLQTTKDPNARKRILDKIRKLEEGKS